MQDFTSRGQIQTLHILNQQSMILGPDGPVFHSGLLTTSLHRYGGTQLSNLKRTTAKKLTAPGWYSISIISLHKYYFQNTLFVSRLINVQPQSCFQEFLNLPQVNLTVKEAFYHIKAPMWPIKTIQDYCTVIKCLGPLYGGFPHMWTPNCGMLHQNAQRWKLTVCRFLCLVP